MRFHLLSLSVVTLFSLSFSLVSGDLYCHNPRGSNNRLNEQSATRNNNNRVFDSQNNARGGYNVGDRSDQPATQDPVQAVLPPQYAFDASNNVTGQYQMVFYEGSILPVSWTQQHGCGGNEANDPQQLNCNMVLQYTCETDSTVTDPALMVSALRDGTTTATITDVDVNQFPNSPTTQAQYTSGTELTKGYHEPAASYYECKTRSRNKRLFFADQPQNNNIGATATRQNPNGGRSGLECPEERDYYPYWGPTIWRDIAYLTDHVEDCPYILSNSQNNNQKFKCVTNYMTATPNKDALAAIGQDKCEAAGGTWAGFTFGIDPPDCKQADWTRVNHLGNTVSGYPAGYDWTLPTISQLKNSKIAVSADGYAKCVLRMRYNITTDDYDPKNTDFTKNQGNGVTSPVTNNPTVDIGANLQGVKLAVNTAQFGRTFQDRSHVFYIRQRPANIPLSRKIYNLNVQGKRGNIVQVYPAVEYDFAPQHLDISQNDLIHLQWTGSNTHNNGGDGGDGQTGDAGEGRGGTDRHNVAQIAQSKIKPELVGKIPAYLGEYAANYPLPLDIYTDNMWTRSKCYKLDGTAIGSSTDCALWATSSGKVRSLAQVQQGYNAAIDPLLNDSPASLIGGIVMDFSGQISPAEQNVRFDYMCTRNNNFSNRSQKGSITVWA